MAKISKITISGFRGIRNEVEFNLQPHANPQCFVLSGENGRGKSSLVDAIEWFYHDTITHLRREGCEEVAYRHHRLPDTDDAFVRIETTVMDSNGDKRLRLVPDANNDVRPRVQWQLKGTNLDNHLALSRSENLIIRHAQLKDFINKTKSEKLNAVSSVIGFDIVPRTRDVLARVRNGLQSDRSYQTSIGSISEKVRDINLITQPLIGETTSENLDENIIRAAEMIRNQVGGTAEITDFETFRQSVTSLSAETRSDNSQLALIYRTLQSQIRTVVFPAGLIDRFNSFVRQAKDLLGKKDVLEKLVLSRLYDAGLGILRANPEINICPLCGNEIDHDELVAHLKDEVEGFTEISQNQAKLKEEGEQLRSEILSLTSSFSASSSSVSKSNLDEKDKWLSSTSQVISMLGKWAGSIASFLLTPSEIEAVSDDEREIIARLQAETISLAEIVQNLINGLNETEEEKTRATNIEKFKNLLSHYERWLSLQKDKQKYDAQISALSTIVEALEQTERNEFNRVLQNISADVNSFYLRLHPDEGFDQLKLIPTQDRGLEFEFIYRGDPITPPGRLMSESHLNTLGLCFFLASVVHYNQQCEFVVLDDVVSSVDANHRLALARLLRDEPRLNQRQFIILSHDMYWSDILKQNFPNWIHKRIAHWSYDAGICLEDEKSIREQITTAFNQGNPIDAGHKVRFFADAVLKDICEEYNILLPYRQAQRNETRQLSDLIIAVQQHFSNNNRFNANQPPLLDIKNCLWLMNIASHPDPRQLNLSMNDVRTIFSDIEQFENLFLNHAAGCRQSNKRLSWDKTNKRFTPCPVCYEPV